jgi:hypothetical protein
MTTSEVEQLFEQLRFEKDDRNPPDERRRGQFKAGWEDATVRGKVYAENTLQWLTWRNLGYRFGLFWVIDPRRRSMRLTRYWPISTSGHRLATQGKPYGWFRGT